MALRPTPSQKTDQDPAWDPDYRGRRYAGCHLVMIGGRDGEGGALRVGESVVVLMVVKGWDGTFAFEVMLAYRQSMRGADHMYATGAMSVELD